jgi:prepilin-type N-terminal cleavage/methylation domain-containing protein
MEEKKQKGRFNSRHTPYAIHHTRHSGFTLVEMIVAVALFAIVMVVCVGALLSLVNANRKAQALQSVMNNLNIALDGIVRNARMGSNYDGSVNCSGNGNSSPKDCTSGSTTFSFEPYGNKSSDPPWVYTFAKDSNGVGRIYKSENGATAIPITAPEVSIEGMEFYVVGTMPGDTTQPKVVIVIKGTAGVHGSSAQTTFHIQATAVQRILDL